MAKKESYINIALDPESRWEAYDRGESIVSSVSATTNEQPPRLPPPRHVAPPHSYEEIIIASNKDNQRDPQKPTQMEDYPKKPNSSTKVVVLRTSTIVAIGFGLMLVVILVQTSLLLSNGYSSENLCECIEVYPAVHETTYPITYSQTPDTTRFPKPQIPTPKARSCLSLRENGSSSSGIYKIFSEDNTWEYEVFCDMETDGGGWTLVGSVHEDNVERKCDPEDRWSVYVASETYCQAKTAWENKLTFGSVSTCTSTDYKNQAYASLKAENVMIWHVPNATPMASMKNKAKLRYRTTNNFLRQVGGNFHSLYRDFYHLNIRQQYALASETDIRERTKTVVEALGKNGPAIISHVPNWYGYVASSGNLAIHNPIFYDYFGNAVTIITSEQTIRHLTYDQEYWWGYGNGDFSTIARAGTPFMMASVIGNEDKKYEYFQTMIESDPPKVINSTEIEGEVVMKNYILQYRTVQFVDDVYSTVCQFHFIVFNEKEWRSTRPSNFSKAFVRHNGLERTYGFQADGIPTNFVMGYILLARHPGLEVTKDMLDNVAETTLSAIADIPQLFNEYDGSDGFVVPVTFDEGDENVVLETVPEKLRGNVEPGYLQLRAYNQIGYPNALCPGLKMNTYLPEYACIGGYSNNVEDKGTCGDYAGWQGLEDPLSGNIDTDYTHSDEDLKTTILIFYR